MHTITKS